MTKISEFTTQITGGLNATDRFEVARPGQAVEFYATPENIKQYVVTPNIAALDALTTTGAIERTGPGTAATFAISAFAKTLLDDADAATARGTLGLGTIATQSAASVAITGGSVTGITDLAIADGGTGASTAVNARANLGLGTAATQIYEEGTWTPSIIGSGTPGSASYSSRVGHYVRIGKLVQIQFFVGWTNGTGSGNLLISGLPFVANADTNNFVAALGISSDIALAANNVAYFLISPGGTNIIINQFPAGGGTAAPVAYDAAGALGLSMCYQV